MTITSVVFYALGGNKETCIYNFYGSWQIYEICYPNDLTKLTGLKSKNEKKRA